MSQTQSSCPTCGTQLTTCNHCAGHRAHEVARIKREQASPTYKVPAYQRETQSSCPTCGTQLTTCNHCAGHRAHEVARIKREQNVHA